MIELAHIALSSPAALPLEGDGWVGVSRPISTLSPQSPPQPLRLDREAGPSFEHVLTDVMPAPDREKAREAATQLVASAFIVPILASLRESPFLEAPFAQSLAEKQFGPLLDQQIADRITKAANFPLVDLIVDRLLGPADRELSGADERRPNRLPDGGSTLTQPFPSRGRAEDSSHGPAS